MDEILKDISDLKKGVMSNHEFCKGLAEPITSNTLYCSTALGLGFFNFAVNCYNIGEFEAANVNFERARTFISTGNEDLKFLLDEFSAFEKLLKTER